LRRDHEIFVMKHASIFTSILLITLATGGAASAQMIPPGASRFSPPPPAPPPSPRIEVPVVPQLDAPIQQNYQSAPQPSFGDRIESCLDEGAAAGLGPNERSNFSRSCADE
jgi:hypothetical protein